MQIIPHFDSIRMLFEQYGVIHAGLFGSRAMGDNTEQSDYDILVDFSPESTTTFLGMIDLKQKLEELLQKNVDLVTKKSLSPYLRDSILKTEIPFYGQKN